MSHVDDGSLHAYLDGALDDLPAAEAERIRSHLASCAACAARLEAERAWRSEAAVVLSHADPGVGEMPPFEEVRARALARPRAVPGVRLRRLAWAASIVVAGGTGWLLRGSQAERFDTMPAATPSVAPTEDARTPVVSEALDEAPAPAAAEMSAASKGAAEAQDVAGVASLGAAAGPPSPGREAEERVRPEPAAPAPQPFRTDEEPASDVTGRVRAAARLVDQAESVAAPGIVSVLGVPGLPLLGFTTEDVLLPAGSTRLLQLLEGDTLEVIHLPSGTDPAVVAGLQGEGRSLVVLPHGNGWLVGRARVSPDSVRALLARVGGSGG